MLESFRALDLTDKNGALCGKILADLGAEVIKIERPGGDSGRSMPPFYRGIAGPERSLYWSFYNRGKKSITLDIETADGQQSFRRMIEDSDFLIESCAPGYLEKLGLGYQALSLINPRIVMTSITPFGQTGPYRDFKADDITLMAMGGLMYVTGDPDRPPLRISIPQAYLLAGAQAAAASMTAHHYGRLTGSGQHVDVSAQNCVMSVLANIIPLWELSGTNLKRVGSFMAGRGAAGVKQRMLFPCKDGTVSLAVMGGPLLAGKNRAFVKWMDQEGQADDFLREWDWDEYDLARATTEAQDRLEDYFARFLLTHTKAEIYDAALKRGFMVAPVSEPRDILENPQLQARGYWQKVEQPQLQAVLSYPGRFFKTSLITDDDDKRPPLVGEHNAAISVKERHQPRRALISPKKAGETGEGKSKGALSDLKIADFGWVLAGPIVTKHLADYGATVVRIESRQRLDIMRATMPYKDGKPGIDRSGYFAFFNSNKYDISLDISSAEGKEVARKLIAWSDIVVENFEPGTMEKLGFGYEALKAIKDDIIMLRLSNQGQTGPYSRYASLGNQLNALAGFVHFTGWPDREPLSLSLAYSDYFCPWFAVSALLAAVEHHRQTGKGQMIDFSQFEAGLQFVGPYLLEYSANGSQGQRMGNAHPCNAPHAAYHCAGDDRWCAIAVSNEQQWQAFCLAIGGPAWSSEPRFASMAERKRNEAELNVLIEAWTGERRPEEVMEVMQEHGIPAGVVKTAQDIFEDPQLKARGHLWPMRHSEMGLFHHLGQPSILSGTPAQPRMPAPCLGEHTEYVCTGLLGITDEEFTRLVASGAFGKM